MAQGKIRSLNSLRTGKIRRGDCPPPARRARPSDLPVRVPPTGLPARLARPPDLPVRGRSACALFHARGCRAARARRCCRSSDGVCAGRGRCARRDARVHRCASRATVSVCTAALARADTLARAAAAAAACLTAPARAAALARAAWLARAAALAFPAVPEWTSVLSLATMPARARASVCWRAPACARAARVRALGTARWLVPLGRSCARGSRVSSRLGAASRDGTSDLHLLDFKRIPHSQKPLAGQISPRYSGTCKVGGEGNTSSSSSASTDGFRGANGPVVLLTLPHARRRACVLDAAAHDEDGDGDCDCDDDEPNM